jgi:hypothetical protein
MLYRILADFLVVIHLAFVVFAVLGGSLLFRWRCCAWVHVPAFLWAAGIELFGWVCPLTPLENWLRERGGGNPYRLGFVEQYILPVLYPAELTREIQVTLGILVLVVNTLIYGWLVRRRFQS